MVTYKSKDTDYMSKLKKAVLVGMPTSSPNEKVYAWNYIRKQITLDDLHTYTASKAEKLAKFPVTGFNAPLAVIFKHPPTADQLDFLDKTMGRLNIAKDQIYVTYLHKCEEVEPNLMDTVLKSELSIVSPALILSFDVDFNGKFHEVVDYNQAKLMTTYDLDWVFEGSSEPEELIQKKRSLWNDILQITAHYKRD